MAHETSSGIALTPPDPEVLSRVPLVPEGSDAYPGAPDSEAEFTSNLFVHYMGSQQEWSTQAAENIQFEGGEHWTQKQRAELLERGQKPLTIQTTHQLVEEAVSMLTARHPAFRATAREGSDRDYAHLVQDLMQWVWQRSRGQDRIKKAIRDYYVQGRGVLHVYPDPDADDGVGEVCFTDLDPKEVFPDPNSTDPLWDDAAHIIVRRILTAEQILARWPDAPLDKAQPAEWQSFASTDRQADENLYLFPEDITDTAHEPYEVFERYTKVQRPFYRVFDPTTTEDAVLSEESYQLYLEQPAYVVERGGESIPVTDPAEVERLDLIYDTVGDVFHQMRVEGEVLPNGVRTPPITELMAGEADHENAIPGTTTRITPVQVQDLIDAGLISSRRFLKARIKVTASVDRYLLYKPYDLPTSHYPIIPIPNGGHRNPYPISDVARVKGLQEAINKTQSLILAHAANMTNMKVFYPRGSIQNVSEYEEQWGKAGTAMIPYDAEFGDKGGISFAPYHPLPTELYHNMDRFIRLMRSILGLFPMQAGDAQSAPQTYKATIALDEFGMRRIKSKMDDIYQSIKRAGEVTLDYAQHIFPADKVIRIARPNGEQHNVEIGRLLGRFYRQASDVFDLIVVAGSTLPSNRWARLETYIDMYGAGIVDDVAVLQHSELPDADEILQRKAVYQKMAQMIEQQEEVISDLQGDLQTWQRAALHAKQRAELEQFKAKLKTYEGSLSQAKQVFESQLRSAKEKQQALLAQERNLRSANERNPS